ncbi:SGNH/GDSL hydrolase family protein [Methylobacterium sp. J-070]|uniref:SGNH/GDSL hydrolase family protein n=1 Tax=Methylobacterium sp. J-070 TaxID=2836650 RepID=UPI001FB98E60|nr:GDSL-type esterase/lipase family protein [Methylobacterium sp. J-070]MCJ2053184.1 GDSL-type esterase/lipase family protein [Methylobacterium sp. J-070]
MRRVAVLVAAGLVVLAIGGLAGWRLRRPGVDARAYAEMRLVAVQVSLDEAPADYVFWGGDSQVELQPGSQRPCGLDLVNGGVSGATAASYAQYLAGLTFKVHPRIAALTIGTNDILVKNNPQLTKPTEQFEAAAEEIIKRFQSLSPRVVVTALPPVGRQIGKFVDARAVTEYSERLRALCGRLGCTFADPFAALRDGDSGFAKPGALRDGLHLAAFRPALRALEPALCRQEPSREAVP